MISNLCYEITRLLCKATTRGSCDTMKITLTYHPDFREVGNSAVLLKHPSVVGEQQLQAEPECEDQGEPK